MRRKYGNLAFESQNSSSLPPNDPLVPPPESNPYATLAALYAPPQQAAGFGDGSQLNGGLTGLGAVSTPQYNNNPQPLPTATQTGPPPQRLDGIGVPHNRPPLGRGEEQYLGAAPPPRDRRSAAPPSAYQHPQPPQRLPAPRRGGPDIDPRDPRLAQYDRDPEVVQVDLDEEKIPLKKGRRVGPPRDHHPHHQRKDSDDVRLDRQYVFFKFLFIVIYFIFCLVIVAATAMSTWLGHIFFCVMSDTSCSESTDLLLFLTAEFFALILPYLIGAVGIVWSSPSLVCLFAAYTFLVDILLMILCVSLWRFEVAIVVGFLFIPSVLGYLMSRLMRHELEFRKERRLEQSACCMWLC
jgi:hypothetical protein